MLSAALRSRALLASARSSLAILPSRLAVSSLSVHRPLASFLQSQTAPAPTIARSFASKFAHEDAEEDVADEAVEEEDAPRSLRKPRTRAQIERDRAKRVARRELARKQKAAQHEKRRQRLERIKALRQKAKEKRQAKIEEKERVRALRKELPKRPMSGYVFFFLQRYKELLAATSVSGRGAIPEVARQVGQEWRALSDAQKAEYQQRAKAVRPPYEQARQQFEAAHPPPPTRPLSGFLRFLRERSSTLKAADPSLKVSELAKLGGQEWKSLSESQKSQYSQSSREDFARYSEALKDYEAKHGKYVNVFKRRLSRQQGTSSEPTAV